MVIVEKIVLGCIGFIIGFVISYIETYNAIDGINVTDSAIDVVLDNYKIYFNFTDLLLIILVGDMSYDSSFGLFVLGLLFFKFRI